MGGEGGRGAFPEGVWGRGVQRVGWTHTGAGCYFEAVGTSRRIVDNDVDAKNEVSGTLWAE